MQYKYFKFLFLTFIFCFSLPSLAGVVEISATANYRYESYDKDNFIQSTSYTASFAYYFWEMSALEISYTKGQATQSTQVPLQEKQEIHTHTEISGVDLVFSFADRKSFFQPYLKAGGAYMKKQKFFEQESLGTLKLFDGEGLVPSAGVGFKVKLSDTLHLKIGADAWSNSIEKDTKTWDYAGRAGISWYL